MGILLATRGANERYNGGKTGRGMDTNLRQNCLSSAQTRCSVVFPNRNRNRNSRSVCSVSSIGGHYSLGKGAKRSGEVVMLLEAKQPSKWVTRRTLQLSRCVRMQAKSRPTKPDDSPLRDGNRDRLVGLLTQRACKTLLFYCSETNQHMYHWLNAFVEQNPIPREGKVEDISGETFLMELMQRPAEQARAQPWLDPLFDCSTPLTVDPRQVAQRIMDIRVQIARELQQDLNKIEEENMEMLRQSLMLSLEAQSTSHPVVPDPEEKAEEEE